MKRIGVDIDGVIADSQPVIIDKLNRLFGKNYTLEDFVDFDSVKMFGVGRSHLDRLIMEKELEIIEEAVPLPGAVETLNQLRDGNRIIIVSARTPAYLNQTLAWLERYGIRHDELLLLGQHDKRQSCLDLCVDIFIEDNKKNAEQIASCGIPVLLMDATYNRGKLPDTITRVHSWTEIRDCILKPL
ncbi:MAG: 5' nucleotidase, NT5C type [Bacillota bacterium]